MIPEIVAVGARGTLDTVISVLESGHLAIIPTETVYGLAARADSPAAVEALFEAKQRPHNRDFAYLISASVDIRTYVPNPPARAMNIARKFFPGPLTLVIEMESGSVGFRCPAFHFPLLLVRSVDFPIFLTSANLSGEAPPCELGEVPFNRLGIAPAIAVDAGRTQYRQASTVVAVRGEDVRILRQGAIQKSLIPYISTGK